MQEIGTVTTTFNSDGKINNVIFTPTKLIADYDLISSFNEALIGSNSVPIQIRMIGERMLARFFSRTTDIELADRGQFDIESEMQKCEKYTSGVTKKCVIKYYLNEKKQTN